MVPGGQEDRVSYCVLVSSGLVFNVVGPFTTKASAKKWMDDNNIVTGLIVPMMPSGMEEP
jgi:hypothetical protein